MRKSKFFSLFMNNSKQIHRIAIIISYKRNVNIHILGNTRIPVCWFQWHREVVYPVFWYIGVENQKKLFCYEYIVSWKNRYMEKVDLSGFLHGTFHYLKASLRENKRDDKFELFEKSVSSMLISFISRFERELGAYCNGDKIMHVTGSVRFVDMCVSAWRARTVPAAYIGKTHTHTNNRLSTLHNAHT